jgi:hypothetical protein
MNVHTRTLMNKDIPECQVYLVTLRDVFERYMAVGGGAEDFRQQNKKTHKCR